MAEEEEFPLEAYFPPFSDSQRAGESGIMQNVLDDGQRPEWGVGVFAQETADGFRLILDRLKRVGEGKPTWEVWSFVTHRTIERAKLLSQEWSEEEYAAFGRTALGILIALVERESNLKGTEF